MEEKCPGLPSYKALYDCAMAFGRADTFPKGRLITYPADWGTRSKDIVAAIELPFQAIAGGSEGAMIAELKSAYSKKEPIMSMFWRPHWIFAELDFNWVEWNPVDGECVEETQTKDTACGFQQAKVEDDQLNQMSNVNNDIENQGMLEIDTKGRDLMEVVNEWIDNNQSTWQPWIDAGMN